MRNYTLSHMANGVSRTVMSARCIRKLVGRILYCQTFRESVSQNDLVSCVICGRLM